MLEQLFNRIRATARPWRKHLTRVSADEIRVRLYHDDTQLVDEQVKTARPEHRHVFHSLESAKTWLGDLARVAVGDLPSRVFVGEKHVNLEASYHSNEVVTAAVPLVQADEYAALREAMEWQGQKDLWRLLSTRLPKNVAPGLRLQLSKLRVDDRRMSDTRINALGLAEGETKNKIEITTPGAAGLPEETTAVLVDWQYTGRVYECFKHEIRLDLILEAEIDDSELMFRLAPVNLKTVLREYRDLFVAFVEETLTPEYAVVMQGELLPVGLSAEQFHEKKNVLESANEFDDEQDDEE